MRQQLRAPIFEDKVIDYVVELADVTDKEVSKDELEKAIEAMNDEDRHPPRSMKEGPPRGEVGRPFSFVRECTRTSMPSIRAISAPLGVRRRRPCANESFLRAWP